MKFLDTIKKHRKMWPFLFLIVVLVTFIPSQPSETIEDTTATVPTENNNPESSMQQTVKNAYFEGDDIVNIFFEKYNAVSNNPISSSDIQNGNIKTKALVYSDLFSMEVVNSGRGLLSVSISSAPENEETVLNILFNDCLKATNRSLSVEDISSAWDALHETGYMVEGYVLGDIIIDYIPSVELTKGHSDLRIDLLIPVNFS